ncbi:MAG TPA: BtaA family protein [Pyrinomonadaceae bacterium]|nr:BtaA family protein [Pyrinomonadaceae bacterium]
MRESALKAAVHNEKFSAKQALLQRTFARYFNSFVYNQIWEDPVVDISALNLNERSRVLTISSGGCNALNYLLHGPKSVTAVDLNPCHIYLLELKKVAIMNLPTHDALFEMFGHGSGKRNGANYVRYIAPTLGRDARRFWESNTIVGGFLFGDRISFFSSAGLYNHSRNGYFLRFFHGVAHLMGCRPEKILTARTEAEQSELFKKKIEPFFDSFLIRSIGKLPITLFGLGIPPQQYDELKSDVRNGDSIVEVYRDRVRRLACDSPIGENYFAWQAFARKYDTENRRAIPEYLKEENYATLTANADLLSTEIGSVTDVIRQRGRGAFDRFVLLDAQDWMNGEQLANLWDAIAAFAEPGSRIIFRTAGSRSPVESKLRSDLRAKFRYEEDLSTTLFKKDRSSIYGGFHLYERL